MQGGSGREPRPEARARRRLRGRCFSKGSKQETSPAWGAPQGLPGSQGLARWPSPHLGHHKPPAALSPLNQPHEHLVPDPELCLEALPPPKGCGCACGGCRAQRDGVGLACHGGTNLSLMVTTWGLPQQMFLMWPRVVPSPVSQCTQWHCCTRRLQGAWGHPPRGNVWAVLVSSPCGRAAGAEHLPASRDVAALCVQPPAAES